VKNALNTQHPYNLSINLPSSTSSVERRCEQGARSTQAVTEVDGYESCHNSRASKQLQLGHLKILSSLGFPIKQSGMLIVQDC